MFAHKSTASVLPDWEKGSCGPHKLAYTSSSLLVIGVILLFLLTTQVDLLPTYGVHNLSSALLLSILDFICCAEPESTSFDVFYARINSTRELFSKLSKSPESINISIKSYSFARPRLMLSTKLKGLTIYALLTYANCWCQRQICLFLLIRWVSQSRPVIAITLLIADMIWLGMTKSRVNKLWLFLIRATVLPPLIRVIKLGSS